MPQEYHPDRAAVGQRRLSPVARGIHPGDVEAIADTAELLLRALPATERVRVISRIIDDLEV